MAALKDTASGPEQPLIYFLSCFFSRVTHTAASALQINSLQGRGRLLPDRMYDKACLHLTEEEVARHDRAGEKSIVRLNVCHHLTVGLLPNCFPRMTAP